MYSDKIHSIINQSQKVLENSFDDIKQFTLDYIAIQSKDSEEYDQLNEAISKDANVFNENKTGITYVLSRPMDTTAGPLNIIKIRKPDEKSNLDGFPDYKVNDYQNFKEQNKENLNVVKSADGVELLELADDEFQSIRIYFPSKPISEDIKNFKMTKENKQNEEDTVQEELANDQPEASNQELEAIMQQLEAEKAKRLSTMAEFENYRKRIESEKATFGAIANMGIIQELLEINDDLNLALSDENLDLENAKQSIQTAQDKLKGAAANAGVEAVEIKVGDEFDKERMEAIQAIPDEKNKNKVVAVISSAYKYANKDGILKAAKVIVGR